MYIRVSHLQFFWIFILFQAGIYARHTKEQEKYGSHMPLEVPFFWSQRLALLAKVTVFGPKKMALRVAKSKF